MQINQLATQDFGPTPERTILTITTWTDTDGISINVFTAGRRNSALSATFLHTDRTQAEAWFTHIRAAARAGQPVWQIEAGISALIDAAQATGGADADLAASINATLDAAERKPVDVSDILDTPAESWDAFRRNTRRDFSRTRVSSQPPTPAQLDRIRQHHDGIVTRASGQPWLLLQGIVDRRLGVAHEQTGQRVTSVRLNSRGLALAEQKELAA
jgi:hypothetical protein